ncbi:AbrB/MazE/SpoVT family DNA-binding domain-containing protein [Rhizobium pisi]|uniref:AbrB/MazE/SpoVT family DNA-binding domain-containing protein n=1 Tax=Rhizobium pisi TaxID=574561 RepID=UPI0039B0E65A
MNACIDNVATHSMPRYSIDIDDTLEVAMRVVVKKWGNSASVRIPAAIMEAAHLSLDEAVDVREEGGRIVIEPVRPAAYDLARLLADITPDNLHGETSFGPPLGKEML